MSNFRDKVSKIFKIRRFKMSYYKIYFTSLDLKVKVGLLQFLIKGQKVKIRTLRVNLRRWEVINRCFHWNVCNVISLWLRGQSWINVVSWVIEAEKRRPHVWMQSFKKIRTLWTESLTIFTLRSFCRRRGGAASWRRFIRIRSDAAVSGLLDDFLICVTKRREAEGSWQDLD